MSKRDILFAQALSGGGSSGAQLPEVTSDDNGKVLTVVEGAWDKANVPAELPAVTSDDNGDVLTVVEGVWAKAEPAAPSGGVIIFTAKRPPSLSYLQATLDDGKTQGDIYNAVADGKTVAMIVIRTNSESPNSVFIFDNVSSTSAWFYAVKRQSSSTEYKTMSVTKNSTASAIYWSEKTVNDPTT